MAKTKKSTIWWKRAQIFCAVLFAEAVSVGILNTLVPEMIIEHSIVDDIVCFLMIATTLAIGVALTAHEILKMEEEQEE